MSFHKHKQGDRHNHEQRDIQKILLLLFTMDFARIDQKDVLSAIDAML